MRPRPRRSRGPRRSSGCRAVAYTYNDPVIFLEYAIDVARGLPRARHQERRGHGRLHLRRAARRALRRTWTPPTSTSRRSPRTSTRSSAPARSQPVLETLEYIRHETDVWLEITTLLIPGHNDGPAEIEALSAWVVDHLGPDVPLHFTAFHPDYKMMDVPHTPPATLTRARDDRAAATGCATSTPATCTTRPARAPTATPAATRLIGRDWYQITAWHAHAGGRLRRVRRAVRRGVRRRARRLGPAAAAGAAQRPCARDLSLQPGRKDWTPRRAPIELGIDATGRPVQVLGTRARYSRGARLFRIRCSVRRCMLSRRAVSETLRLHCSNTR